MLLSRNKAKTQAIVATTVLAMWALPIVPAMAENTFEALQERIKPLQGGSGTIAEDPDAGKPVPPVILKPTVVLVTNHGTIYLSIEVERAPITAANFLNYVNSGFYNGTIFHRVIADFMVQGGGLLSDLAPQETNAPIANESHNGLSNVRGAIAMARTQDPHSATSQFFINLRDNSHLNKRGEQHGYTVFGHVTKGMDVVNAIAKQATEFKSGIADVPKETITIQRAYVIKTKTSLRSTISILVAKIPILSSLVQVIAERYHILKASFSRADSS